MIEPRVRRIPGVRAVEGNPLTGSVRIDYDPSQLAERGLIAALGEITSELDPPERPQREAAGVRQRQRMSRAPLLRAIGTGSVLTATCCFELPAAVAAGLVLVSGLPALVRAGSTVASRRRLNGDVLEASTLILLTLRGNYAAGALLSWLRSVGEYVMARSVVTTRRSLRELVAPADQTVTRRRGERSETMNVSSLEVGDQIVLGSGRSLPVDGTVVDGEAVVNQQTMTGEALPVERHIGDRVFAATTVVHGEIAIRVDQVGADTAVGRIVTAIEAAADEKPEIQVFAERLADREVSRTLALAALGTVVSRSIDAGAAILVADYGTAARVGIPAALVASIRRASGHGILIKGPQVLEQLARVDTVVFDKTGTLTSGMPRIHRTESYDSAVDVDEMIGLVAAAENGFNHPVARAVARLARERKIEVPTADTAAQTIGLGVEVRVKNRRVRVGSRRFIETQRIDLEAAARDEADAHAIGASPTFVAVDDRLLGMLVLEDELRDDAKAAVRELRARKMRNVIMLSGDHPEPSRVIAEALGLRHHYAELLPADKAKLVRELQTEGRVVAMVGDGVNDALALSQADVGIAVPGGAELAADAADVVLLSGGLDRVVRSLDIGRESLAAVRRTLSVAGRANLLVVGLASFGLARPVTSILLSHGTTVGAALVSALDGRLTRRAGPHSTRGAMGSGSRRSGPG